MTLRDSGGAPAFYCPRQSVVHVIETDSGESPFLTGWSWAGGSGMVSDRWIGRERIALCLGRARWVRGWALVLSVPTSDHSESICYPQYKLSICVLQEKILSDSFWTFFGTNLISITNCLLRIPIHSTLTLILVNFFKLANGAVAFQYTEDFIVVNRICSAIQDAPHSFVSN